MRLLNSYFNYMKEPNGYWFSLFDRGSFLQSCVGYLVAAISWVIFFNIGDAIGIAALLAKIFFRFLAQVTLGYFVASLAGMFLSFQKAPVSSADLFSLIGASGFIKSLLIVAALISAAFPEARLGLAAPLVLLAVWALQVCFLTREIKRLGNISAGRALSALLLGVLPGFMLFFLCIVFFVWSIALLV